MIDKNKLIKVQNRDNGSVGYNVPDLDNLHRDFQPDEEKEITMEELRKLSYISGGQYLIENCLIIKDDEAIEELLNSVEPEYYYTREDIKNLLENGSLDELLDCLDFAPDGVINLLKTIAVEINLNDVQKRKAILDKTGFNVNSAIYFNVESSTESSENKSEDNKRRVAVTPQPRKYKVVQ